jgi:nitroreductase/dihydropteridine reductase
MIESTLLEQLNWRYATKKMDTTKTVPQEKLDVIIEAIRMAPTSSGTQPFELLVVTNPEKLAAIQKAAGDQAQITIT